MNYNLIGLAPWFSVDCTIAYLNAAADDPIRGLIFYKPNNSTNKPQDPDAAVWDLNGNANVLESNKFPVFAIPGLAGQQMMTQLSLYSGNLQQVPHGADISQRLGPNPNDYVRIWTELQLHSKSSLPQLWIYFLVAIGALIFIVIAVSFTMHFVQRRRRVSLRRRVECGEVDLEAMGIKRLAVPSAHVRAFPLFTYTSDPGIASGPPTPSTETFGSSTVRSSRPRRPRRQRTTSSDMISPASMRSVRSMRSTLTGTTDMAASNYQPQCHICLDDFEDRITIIRELPCHHIFHPVCIDEFLTHNSSLCPMCKHSMLPQGYSPKITNGMVRRERALRRLREKVDLDDSSIESAEAGLKGWSKRFFRHTSSAPEELPMANLKNGKKVSSEPSTNGSPDRSDDPPSDEQPAEGDSQVQTESETSAPAAATSTPQKAQRTRPRRSRPKAISVLPTQPEGSELRTTGSVGRHSPSSFARQRMRAIAMKNAPFDDPDSARPKCKFACLRLRHTVKTVL